jgi:geranylgeranyl diphosphate synthase type I
VSNDVPEALRARAARVDTALLPAVAPALARVDALDPALAPWTAELSGMLAAGGKRLRPALVLLGHAAVGGESDDDVLPAGLAVELLHTCALLHDDLIDGAATRRGRTTAHVSFSARHHSNGLAGDGDRYGAAAAVLVGDLAFVMADEQFLRCTVPAAELLAGLRLFTLLREEVMAGQALDVEAAATRASSRELALAVAAAKSGRYSVARPLELGAVLAGADPALAAALARAVEPLGQAFQVRDDLLGVFGDQGVTGKSAAGDLREGKRTLLVAEAMARLDEPGRASLERLLGDPDLDDEGVERARDLLAASGAVDATQAWIDGAVERGLGAVAQLPLARAAVADLEQVGAWLVGRDA